MDLSRIHLAVSGSLHQVDLVGFELLQFGSITGMPEPGSVSFTTKFEFSKVCISRATSLVKDLSHVISFSPPKLMSI